MIYTREVTPYDAQYLELLRAIQSSNTLTIENEDESVSFRRIPGASISVYMREEFPILRYHQIPPDDIITASLMLIENCGSTLSELMDIITGETCVSSQSIRITTTDEEIVACVQRIDMELYGNIAFSGNPLSDIPLKIAAYALLLKLVAYTSGLSLQYVTYNILNPTVTSVEFEELDHRISRAKLLDNLAYTDDSFREKLLKEIDDVELKSAITVLDWYPQVQISVGPEISIFDIEPKDITFTKYGG